MANECVDDNVKAAQNRILCKLDLEKAYEHVNWNFLDYMMGWMGFGRKWRHWMMMCIRSVSFLVLLNGSSEGYFSSTRGLRQGDPNFPYLFIKVTKGLFKMITRATDGFIKGFTEGREGMPISHLQFVDNTLIFCEADIRKVDFFRCFEAVSG